MANFAETVVKAPKLSSVILCHFKLSPMSKKIKFGLKLIIKNLGNVNIKSAHVMVKIVFNISWYYSMYLDNKHLPDVKRWSEHKTILAWYYNAGVNTGPVFRSLHMEPGISIADDLNTRL